jgi:putative ABC transport system permease protein
VLSGRITTIGGAPAAQRLRQGGSGWLLRSDRRLTYAADMPPDTELISGKWWPRDYAGPPLVSIADDVADGFGIGAGDRIGFSILGREIEAEVANVRQVAWDRPRLAFALVFAPGTLEAARPGFVATLRASDGALSALLRDVPRDFPGVVPVPTAAALETAEALLGKLALAARLVAAVSLASGMLVLAGALGAGLRARLRDAVILKVLGADRRRILSAFLLEYGGVGLLAALLAAPLGGLGAWWMISRVMGLPWNPAWGAALAGLGLGLAVPLGLAGLAAARALSQSPSRWLRNE